MLFLPVDDVDDPGHAGGVEAGRRVVDDLDRLDVGGRDAVESALTAEAGQARLPAVDQDGHAVAAPQQDSAVLVDGDARKAPHRVEQRSGRLRGPLVEPEQLRVDASRPRPERLRRHGDLLLETLQTSEPDVAKVVGLVELADEHIRLHRVEAGKGEVNPVGSRRQPLDDEAAIFSGERAGDGRARLEVLDDHRREGDRGIVGDIQDAAGEHGRDLLSRCRCGDEWEDEQRQQPRRGATTLPCQLSCAPSLIHCLMTSMSASERNSAS